MDIHTATEQAYKNGFEEGRKMKLTAKEANFLAKVENDFEKPDDEIFAKIYRYAKAGLFSTTVGIVLASAAEKFIEELTAKGYKVECGKEYYYKDRCFKDGPYVDMKISWGD